VVIKRKSKANIATNYLNIWFFPPNKKAAATAAYISCYKKRKAADPLSRLFV